MNKREEKYFWIDKYKLVLGAEVHCAAEPGEIEEIFSICKRIVERIRAKEEME